MSFRRAAAALLLVPGLALANGYNVPNVNPRDLAMADSARASQSTAAAVYANPAALADVQGLNLSLGLSLLDLRTTWNAPDGFTPARLPNGQPGRLTDSLDFKPVPPPALFVSYGGKFGERGWGAGVGMNIPQGGNVFWPGDWAGRFRIITVDRKVYGFYGTAGVDIVKGLKLGGGLVYYYTTETLNQDAANLGLPDIANPNAELKTSGGALAWDIAALITPVESLPLSFSVDYKHQGVQTLKGDAKFTNVTPGILALDPRLVNQSATHVLTIPNVLNVNAAYRVLPPLLVTAGFTFDRYVVYPEDVFVGSKGVTVSVPRHYSNGNTYRLGAEYDLSERYAVRAGVLRDISGLKRETYSPTLPDANAWAGGLGGSVHVTRDLAIDLAFFYAKLDEVSSTATTDVASGPFPGRYDSKVFIYSAAVVWGHKATPARDAAMR